MSKLYERIKKRFSPDGFDYNGPYWILPSDRKTYDFEEWALADIEYWKGQEQ